MKKVLLTAVCFSVMALGALNVQAADDMPLPPPPPHHGEEKACDDQVRPWHAELEW